MQEDAHLDQLITLSKISEIYSIDKGGAKTQVPNS